MSGTFEHLVWNEWSRAGLVLQHFLMTGLLSWLIFSGTVGCNKSDLGHHASVCLDLHNGNLAKRSLVLLTARVSVSGGHGYG